MTGLTTADAPAARRGVTDAAPGAGGGRSPAGGGAPRQRRSAAAELEARGSWLVTASIMSVLMATLAVIQPIFAGHGWLSPAVAVIATVLACAAITRTLFGSAPIAALAGLLGGMVAVALGSQTTSLPAIPTEWGSKVLEGIVQLGSDSPPIRDTPAVVLLLLLLLAFTSIMIDVLALGVGLGAIALLPAAVLFLLPMLTDTALPGGADGAWRLVLLGLAIAFHLVTTALWRRRIADAALADEGFLIDDRGLAGTLGAAGITALAVAAALALTAVIPPPSGLDMFKRDTAASLASNRVNPIVDLGEDLRRSKPVEVFQYATTRTEGTLPYFELVTLTQLGDAASEWSPTAFAGDTAVLDGVELPRAAGVGEEAAPAQSTVGIVTQRGASAYLPIPGEARRITGLAGEYSMASATGDIRERNGDSPAQVLELTSDLPLADPVSAAGVAQSPPGELIELTAVPGGEAADAIRAVLDTVVDGDASPYQQALQLRTWLAETGGFDYSLTAPLEQGYDGTNLEVIAQFLTAKSGYCVHFASAMAIMARMLGIPARVAVGFTPGTPAGVNGDGQQLYSVTSDNLHSWAELYVPGLGWTQYEATPAGGLGELSAVDPAATATADATATPTPTPTPDDGQGGGDDGGTPTPTASPSTTPDADGAPSEQGGWAPPLGLVLGILGTIAAVLALLAIPIVVRRARRARRRAIVLGRRVDPDEPPGLAAWRELRDEAYDLGSRSLDTGTPAAVEQALAQAMMPPPPARGPADAAQAQGASDAELEAPSPDPLAVAALGRIRAAHEAAAFDRPERRGGGAGAELWDDVERVARALRAAATPAARRGAAIAPRSATTIRQPRQALARIGRRSAGDAGGSDGARREAVRSGDDG